MSSPTFDARALSFAYRGIPAISELSAIFQPGERVALIGANGSGKSTLLRLLAGLSLPDHGTIYAFGQQLNRENLENEEFCRRFRRRVGFLFQNPDIQLFNPSVFDEVAFGPLQLRLPKNEIRAMVERTLWTMGIEDLRDRAPHRLSGGEKKRVALASILVLDPEVLLLDEPTAALDPTSQSHIVDLLKSWKGGTKTVLTATHELDTLEDIADRCIVLDNGRLAGEGTPVAILHDLRLLTAAKLMRPQSHAHPHLHADDLL